MFGAAAFLAFALLATHVLIGLYTTSVVTSAAWDGARLTATHPDNPDERALAETQIRSSLDGLRGVHVAITTTETNAVAHVSVDRPSFLPAALASDMNALRIDRTASVRLETVQ